VKGLTVLVADDERPARQKIRRLLSAHADVGAVFEAPDGVAALRLIREAHPELVFLDVEMPGMTGAEVMRAIAPGAAPHVVFVTAYDHYAVEAFDLAAVDYLLKPFDRERFDRALGRARESLAARERREDLERALRLLAERRQERADRLLVEHDGRTFVVATADVERVEAERNYVRVYAPPAAYRMRETLQALEQRLDPRRFARIARGTIVNLDRVRELRPVGHGDSDVLLRSGATVRLSRRYRSRLG
jgi:two-component system LytT family response regulator